MTILRVEHLDRLTRRQAWRYASHRTIIGLFGGLVALGIMMAVFATLPKLEAAIFPVVTDFSVEPIPVPAEYKDEGSGANVVAFRVHFNKVRDCVPAGRAFYAILSSGLIYRLNAEQPDLDASTVGTGRPLGFNIGGRIVIALPADAVSVSGEQTYDCGWPWASLRQIIGPFDVASLRR